jgi:hypothetical protein
MHSGCGMRAPIGIRARTTHLPGWSELNVWLIMVSIFVKMVGEVVRGGRIDAPDSGTPTGPPDTDDAEARSARRLWATPGAADGQEGVERERGQ